VYRWIVSLPAILSLDPVLVRLEEREMDDPDIRYRPEMTSKDKAYTNTKALVSAIPGVGGPLAEVFSAIIAPPIAKRRDEWVESIARQLVELQEKVDGFKIEDLSQNETFITVVMHASQVAIRNHQKEKLEALRNAVLNSALPNAPEDDIQLMFLNFVDALTSLHLVILGFLNDPGNCCQRRNVEYPSNMMADSISSVLELAIPELEGKRDTYDQVVKDLFSRGLIGTGSLHALTTPAGIFASRTTDFGKRFIKFVTSPIEDDDGRKPQ